MQLKGFHFFFLDIQVWKEGVAAANGDSLQRAFCCRLILGLARPTWSSEIRASLSCRPVNTLRGSMQW
jgi:hypothetical protein